MPKYIKKFPVSGRSRSKSCKYKKLNECTRSHEKNKNNISGNRYNRSRSRSKNMQACSRRSSTTSSSSSSSTSSTSSSSSSSTSSSLTVASFIEQKRYNKIEARRQREHKERRQLKSSLTAKEKDTLKAWRRTHFDCDSKYSNDDNPFGDSNLSEKFRWKKKIEKEGLKNFSNKTAKIISLQKEKENKLELEMVRKRRIEREMKRKLHHNEVATLQRAKEAEEYREWQRQEKKFHLYQARLRSEIRIRDGRAKPIDLLAQYIYGTTDDKAIEMQVHEPYMLLNGLTMDDLEDLLIDIKVYMDLEKEKNIEFWNDMVVIVEDELKQIKVRRDNELQSIGRREGIHPCVIKDVVDVFRSKSTAELDVMRIQIEDKVKKHSKIVDISYWESLLSQLKAFIARTRLREHHQEFLREKLKLLKSEFENEEVIKIKKETVDVEKVYDDNEMEEIDSDDDTLIIDTEREKAQKLYDQGNYSPKYIQDDDLDSVIKVIDEYDLVHNIFNERAKVVQGANKKEVVSDIDTMTPLERQMYDFVRHNMPTDDFEFIADDPIEVSSVSSANKYRPRKPRFFNRVHTGFEWNKYNQTHYDQDNAPPKIVQGYKFNIFYPDLFDKTKSPKYSVSPCPDNRDFLVVRFHAGPPYEDIAFKIVNREWEFSFKRGFRCQFQSNIFQLWFHFKRHRYRR